MELVTISSNCLVSALNSWSDEADEEEAASVESARFDGIVKQEVIDFVDDVVINLLTGVWRMFEGLVNERHTGKTRDEPRRIAIIIIIG